MKSELFSRKIRLRIFESRPAFPFASASLQRAKQENFLNIFFNHAPPKFFSIKEKKISLFCLPLNRGIAKTLPPKPRLWRGKHKQTKIPSSRPSSFLPICFSGFALKFFGGDYLPSYPYPTPPVCKQDIEPFFIIIIILQFGI